MVSPKPPVLLLAGLLAVGAASARTPQPDILQLYADAVFSERLGFSCTPRAVPNGPAVPDYQRMRRALGRRLERVAQHMLVVTTRSRIEEVERAVLEQEHGIYRTGCDLDETRRAREHYQRVLREMERRLYPHR